MYAIKPYFYVHAYKGHGLFNFVHEPLLVTIKLLQLVNGMDFMSNILTIIFMYILLLCAMSFFS